MRQQLRSHLTFVMAALLAFAAFGAGIASARSPNAYTARALAERSDRWALAADA
jgi:hypothetical protein